MSNARFSIIPAWIVTDSRLKGSDLKILCLLGTYTNKEGWCRRSQVKMAEQLGCARSTVQGGLDRLAEIGVVEKRRVESADGRDSAHWYRVILDRATPERLFEDWDGEDEKEFGPISAPQNRHPPAAISAPPAGPGSAPPAGSGPAPINDRSLTISSNEIERARACETEKEEEEENPKSIEKAFWRVIKEWPSFDGMPKDKAKRAWFGLTAAQRRLAEERRDAWFALLKAQKKDHTPAPYTYFHEQLFNDVPAVMLAPEKPKPSAAFGKAWNALRFARLHEPKANLPRMTPFLEAMAKDETKGPAVRRDHEKRYAWPAVTEMHGEAQRFTGTVVPADIASIGEAFVGVKVGGPVWDAWIRAHERRNWPFLPDPGKREYVYFPPLPEGGPVDLDEAIDAAIEDFAAKLKEVRGDEHAA